MVGNSLEDEWRDKGGAVDEYGFYAEASVARKTREIQVFWLGQISEDEFFEAVFVNVNTKRSAGFKGYFWMEQQEES